MIFVDPDELVIITDPADPLYDPRAELPIRETDVRNVARHGLIEPVIGRRRGDKVVVIDGRQRVRWARAVNRQLRERGSELMKVAVVIRTPVDDGEAFEVAVSANEIRIDDGPIERARKAARLQKLGRSLADVAAAFGVSKGAVQSWWRLMELHPDVQQAAAEGRVRLGDAVWEIGRLPLEKQPAALHRLEHARPTSAAKGGSRRSGPRPGRAAIWRLKALVRFLAANADTLPPPFTTVLLWVLKEKTDAELVEACPALKPLSEEGFGDRTRRRRVVRQRQAALNVGNGTKVEVAASTDGATVC